MNETSNTVVWRHPQSFILIFLFGILMLGIMSYSGMVEMAHVWEYKEEYGHGYIIPFISLFLLWQKKSEIEQMEYSGSWVGVALVAVSCLILFAGNLTTITTIVQYGALGILLGLILSFTGSAMRPIFIPLFFLVFMIPLPGFFLNNLSAKLQLISSELGVAVIRLFDISVYLEGNVIDLGVFQLQVVEACSGLNYLFPLMSLAFMMAYFFKAPFWQRAIIFLTSMPITVFMNSFRIGVIGVLVDKWGIEQAEGFLHYFEGWIIFMSCMLILFLEIWLFVRFSKKHKSVTDVLSIDFPDDSPADAEVRNRPVSKPFIASILIITIGMLVNLQIEQRDENIPQRESFSAFPSSIDNWVGRTDKLEASTLNVLKLSDYLLANYTSSDGGVNLYSAYYESQRGGASAHSPRSCIPGGGWQIKKFETVELQQVPFNGKPLRVNRLLIKKGDYGQLVYYWFQQRNRNITNEYMVKWYLFMDALTKNRTDGALVRLTTHVKPGEDVSNGDKRLAEFAKLVQPHLSEYIPE